MPKKRILKNHCRRCRYDDLDDREAEVCLCDIYPFDDDTNECGCNYKASTLSKLYRYTMMERNEAYSDRNYRLSDLWDQTYLQIALKEERGEEVSVLERAKLIELSDDLKIARTMNFDHKRCNYIRLINELDEKGEFKRLLKKLGRYPKFVDDFTIGPDYEEDM